MDQLVVFLILVAVIIWSINYVLIGDWHGLLTFLSLVFLHYLARGGGYLMTSHSKLRLPDAVEIWEVGPRDGFQAETEWISTDTKVQIIKELASTGIKSMEITSFVHPRAIPQLKDAEEVVQRSQELTHMTFRALVPNLKGAERAIHSGIKKLKLMLSATDSHSTSNANSTVEEAQLKHDPIIDYAVKHGVKIGGSISVAFGCPFEGHVPLQRIKEIITRYHEKGVTEISLADTSGLANPKQVDEMLGELRSQFPNTVFLMHLHNTRGMALANAVAAMQHGVVNFDSSIAGLGGCPYAPGATGNIATEDLVYSLEEMGVQTGVNIDSIINVAKSVKDTLGHDGGSYMLKAGSGIQLVK